MDDDVEDGLNVADAYRKALELDTMDIMNAMSRCSGEGTVVYSQPSAETGNKMGPLEYYLVGSDWLKRAWHHVLKPQAKCPRNWIEIVGPIDNYTLVGATEDERNATNQSAGMPTGTADTSKLLEGLEHEKDFYLLGSQSWMLLSRKFGSSHTFPCQVKVHRTAASSVAVDPYSKSRTISYAAALDTAKNADRTSWVPVPASGRFPYEQTLNDYDPEQDHNAPKLDNKQAAGASGGQFVQQGALVPHAAVESRQQVSDSESEANSNVAMKDNSSDGVPEDDEIDGHDTENSQRAIVLLPPSSDSATQAGDEQDDFGFGSADANNSDDYWAMDSDPVGPAPKMKTITSLRRYRYGSGLGNLGNTCFMNSTLQCLGHSHALQRYFLSGDFKKDLNRDNPLGTGGELASAFAKLLTDMWSEETTKTVDANSEEERTVSFDDSSSHVVYPREFKTILGRHAEQFMGYDQHDSQEFATYLLDALHEDTNRITKKPYIEKPEQEEGESDEQAADKAWALHLQRENSRVLENFMGQVKSRVKCCEPGCGRVSTTFDPFMYLSVPIPGSLERTLSVFFVPLDTMMRAQKLNITIPKTAKISELVKRTRDEALKLNIVDKIAVEDLIPVDIWNKEVYQWYKLNDDVERIRDNDLTYIYQVRSAAELRAEAEKNVSDGADEDQEMYNLNKGGQRHYTLDLATLTKLNRSDAWTEAFGKYLTNHLGFLNAFNPNKGTTEDRIKLYERAQSFLKLCYNNVKDLDGADGPQPNETVLQELEERCHNSPVFENVRTIHDLAILEHCVGKMRVEILRLIKAEKSESPGGVNIVVRMRCTGGGSMGDRVEWVCAPAILRIPTSLTVYDLRKEIGSRFSRSLLHPGELANQNPTPASGQATSESEASQAMDVSAPASHSDNSFGPRELMLMRRIPLTYDKKSPGYTTKSYDNSHPLGSIEKSRYRSMDSRPTQMASARDSEEQHIVARLVGENGLVNVEWTAESMKSSFDPEEADVVEDPNSKNGGAAGRVSSGTDKTFNVLDCIEKYCQEEQLEETEMWYCNRCKKHVRAWKQFRLYRMPPILIVHLKRFQYSATTHRRDKISQMIDFPLEGLDLTDQVMFCDNDRKPIYDCFAVSNHYGGLGGGHYTAHALNDDGAWCYYDDSRITSNVDPSDAVTDAAYVLYYRRRDLGVDKDFLLKIKTPEPETLILRTTPSAIANVAASSAAVVDDDNMDVDDTASRGTSTMSDHQSYEDVEHDAGESGQLPRQ